MTGPQGQGVNANEAQLAAEHRAIVLSLIEGVDAKVDGLRDELQKATSDTRGDIKEIRAYFAEKIDKLEEEVQMMKVQLAKDAEAERLAASQRRDLWARLAVIVPITGMIGGIGWWILNQVAKGSG